MVTILLSSCDLNKINLDRNDDELIPNYNITLDEFRVSKDMQSDIIVIRDNLFAMAIEDNLGEIIIVEIGQEYDETWNLTMDSIQRIGEGRLTFFDAYGENYLIGFNDLNSDFHLQILDKSYNSSQSLDNLESFIDTSYNDIDSLHLTGFSYDEVSMDIVFGGVVFTQGTSYSCVLKTDQFLNPLYFKTYFAEHLVTDILCLEQDTYLLLTAGPAQSNLIRDNTSGAAYTKYKISEDRLFFGLQAILDTSIIYLTGVSEGIGRTMEVNLETESAFVNDIEIYPVSDVRALYLTRNNIITTGIQVFEDSLFHFSSELYDNGSLWCKRDRMDQMHRILDFVEMPGKGMLTSAIIDRNNSFFIQLTRIDEEGARFNNEFTENCI